MGTATSVLECQKRYPWLPESNCAAGSLKKGQFGSNPAITGIGTDLSFVITAGLSILVCGLVQLLCDRLRLKQLRILFEPLVVSFSDQQIIRGLSMSIATLYTPATCTIDAYRYNILCYLILMSIVSHLSALLVLRSYVNGQKSLSAVRFGLVFAQIFFAGIIFSSRVTANFPINIPGPALADNTTMVLPAVCFQLADSKPYSGLEELPKARKTNADSLASYIVLVTFYTISIVFTIAHIFTHYFKPGNIWEVRAKEERAKSGTWFWWLGLFRGLILLGATCIYIWAVVEMYRLKTWMDGSGWMSAQSLGEDSQWTYGQLLSIFLLGAAPLSLLNAWSGYRRKEDEEREENSKKDESARTSGFFPHPPAYSEATGSNLELQRLIR